MWLLERCRKEWKENYDYGTLIEAAMKVPAFQSLISPDSPCFANPVSMIEAIQNYCKVTGQYVPETYGEITRCIFDSLALRYRQVMNILREMAGFPIERLHIIGGGSRNQQLSQFTSNAVNLPVTTGPVEGTAIGNIMLQAKAAGLVETIGEMRQLIAKSIETQEYLPQDAELWDKGYEKYLSIYREDI
jgi:rhamnulokinase